MVTKEYCQQKYMEFKNAFPGVPLKKEFLRFAKILRGQLEILYGRDAYSKLQKDCGDKANKLDLERTPREKIMRQYGDLAKDLQELPRSTDWVHHGLRPSISGLEKAPHFIKWSDFPSQFMEWVKGETITGYEEVLGHIQRLANTSKEGLINSRLHAAIRSRAGHPDKFEEHPPVEEPVRGVHPPSDGPGRGSRHTPPTALPGAAVVPYTDSPSRS